MSFTKQGRQKANNFFQKVYALVKSIPRGRVITYGQIATFLGAPHKARQVGWAMHGCPQGLPWQRVVGAGGKILINSHSKPDGPILQRRLLEIEGVRFKSQYVDMKAHQYVPSGLERLRRNSLRKRGKP
jgi:methylated-DNA-protein-cysteine methyltransferase-like protein